MKEKIRLIQAKIGVEADGIMGPRTVEALMLALKVQPAPVWPTQEQVRAGRSMFGAPGDESQLVSIRPAYPLYFEGAPVRSIRVHRLVAPHVEAALHEVLEYYGLERIRELGLDQYGGSYNYRKSSGGSSLSMHAWGIALDFAPEGNGLKTPAPVATLSRQECVPWWEIWERHGAVSLGRQRDYDWMHLQFANL